MAIDKLVGTVIPQLTKDSKISSIKVKVKISAKGIFKVSDIQLQEGTSYTQHNCNVSEHYQDEHSEVHHNFLARGVATLIIPYMSEVPFDTAGVQMPCETEYITTPIKADILIHKPFVKEKESLTLGSGLTGTAKRFELNMDVDKYVHCVYDGYTSRQYIDGIEQADVFVGRELRLANADAKFTLNQNGGRKSTGVLSANKTRREV